MHFYDNTLNNHKKAIKLPPFQTFQKKNSDRRNRMEEEEINTSRIAETINFYNPATPLLKNKQKTEIEMKVKTKKFE